jgi:hypothetical protein
MRSRAFATIVLVAALAVPTAAVAVGEQESVGPITLESTSQYATVEDGELRVDFESLNDRATTRADGVFRIAKDAGEPARVWVTVDTDDGVVAYRGGDPSDRVDEKSGAVRLADGDSLSVGFEIDTHGSVPDAGTVTVHADPVRTADGPTPAPGEPETTSTPENDTDTPPASGTGTDPGPVTPNGDANLSVGDVTVSSERVTAGEPVRVTATVRNDGEAPGTATVGLTADGDVVARRTVTVPAGTSRTVTFERVLEETGRLRLGMAAGERTQPSGGTVDLLVNDRPSVGIEVPENATAGEPTTLRADVTDEVGNVTVTWQFADGSTATGPTVTRSLADGELVEVTATDEFGATGRAERTIAFGAVGAGASPSFLPYASALDAPVPVLAGLGTLVVLLATFLLVQSGPSVRPVLRRVAGYTQVLGRSGPRITALSGASWDPERGRLVISELRIEADGLLETVVIVVTDASGREVVRKTIETESGDTYVATPERVRIPGSVEAAPADQFTLRVRAVDTRQRIGVQRQAGDDLSGPEGVPEEV